MAFCEHCTGQRYDRARVLRALRQLRRNHVAGSRRDPTDAILSAAIQAIRALDVPHLDPPPDVNESTVIH